MVKNYPLDVTAVPFGRDNAGCMVFCEASGEKHDAENGLYLSQKIEGALMGGAQFLRNKNYLLITPTQNGAPVPYTYEATTSKLGIEGADGTVGITFSSDGAMRIKAEKLDLRLTAKMGFGDTAMVIDGSARVEMDGAVYFIVPLRGSVTVDSHYDLLKYRYTDPVINFDAEDGVLEIAVYSKNYTGKELPAVKGAFEDCVQQMQEDFAAFAARIVPVSEGLEQLIYSLWIAKKIDDGMYPSNVITAVYPKAKEQPILSLAFADADMAQALITNFAKHATKLGLIPEYVNKKKKLYQTVSIDYGYAALELLKKGDLTADQLTQIYDLLATVNDWWTKNRSDDAVSFYYAYRFECGNVNSSVLGGGVPVITPDLMTNMVLLAQALAGYAEKIGAPEAAEKWHKLAQERMAYLLENLWVDGKFICRLTDGTAVDSDSLLCWMPLLLGKQLPANIADAAEKVMLEQFLVDGSGLKLEVAGDAIDTTSACLIIAGLCDAGKSEAAAKITAAMQSFACKNGVYMTYSATNAPEKRCGSLYQPAASAAMLFAVSKQLQKEVK